MQVAISLRPDTVSRDSVLSTTDTTSGGLPIDSTSDTTQLVRGFCNGPISSPLVALLRSRPNTGTTFLGVDNYIMKWKITSPDSLAGTGSPNDTSKAAFIIGTDRITPSIRDTTKGGGLSTRFLEFGGRAFAIRADTDTVSVTVQASATYRQGAAVPGAVTVLIRFVKPSKC
jgi:hypothetical protein